MKHRKGQKTAYRKQFAFNQSGFTLVELLICIAILSVVAASVCSFIIVGSKSYASANTEISLQQEAQMAMNQMSDVIIDTTRSVNYIGYPEGSTSGELAEKDADFSFQAVDKTLTLYNGEENGKDGSGNPIIVAGSGNQKNYQFYWSKADEELYYSEIDVTQDSFSGAERVLLAEHVSGFSADLSQVEEKRIVQLTLTFAYNGKEYTTTNNITIRNKVLINNIEVPPIDKKVELSVQPKETVVILEPGESYHFSTPKVSGKNVMDKTVTWSLASGYTLDAGTYFTDNQNGIIQISSAETITEFTVEITTNAVNSEGNPAKATVTVKVKKAHDVAIHKKSDEDTENSADEVSAGKKFVLTAEASGNLLGTMCDGCGDSTAEDKYVIGDGDAYAAIYNWEIVQGAGLVTMESSDHKEATFQVSETAKKGDVIEIRATSLLSVRKGYTKVVQGTLKLTVAEEKEADISIGGEIRYGRATKIGINNPDFNKGGQGYYIVCARIKETKDAPTSSDKVMLYGTNGADTWLTPDLFGLYLDKTYYISIQLIDPGKHFNVGDALVSDVVSEYNSHLNSSGTYIGTKYVSSSKLMFALYSPQIGITYNGKLYDGTPVKIDPIYASAGGTTVSCPVTKVSNAREEIMDKIRIKVYSGTGDNSSGWEFKYGWNGSGYSGNSRIGGLDFASISNVKDMSVKLEGNNAEQAIGTYHYVPYLIYANEPPADHGYNVYYKNYEPDYAEHTYERTNSTISFEIKGGNLNNIWVYADNAFRKGNMYFPAPSDSGFTNYFDRENTAVQESKQLSNNWFNIVQADGNKKSVQFTRMTCQYIAVENKYVLELFFNYYDSTWGRDVLCSAGTFTCGADENEWSRATVGTYDSLLESGSAIQTGGNVMITNMAIDNPGNIKNGEAYIPVPMEDNFVYDLGFTRKMSSEQTVNWKNIKFKEAGSSSVNSISCPELRCSYNAATDTYTLKRYYYDYSSGSPVAVLAGTFTCKSDSTRWTQIP
ncbi:MAG: prepilin-type N-terminal cleavage/methylation domain-containing protein [Lachnospiraceae bacterium]|nr:prepilin-type N-terminal cleavage/methylation domain-containing protein [Lachnospiraceae bacterium]